MYNKSNTVTILTFQTVAKESDTHINQELAIHVHYIPPDVPVKTFQLLSAKFKMHYYGQVKINNLNLKKKKSTIEIKTMTNETNKHILTDSGHVWVRGWQIVRPAKQEELFSVYLRRWSPGSPGQI